VLHPALFAQTILASSVGTLLTAGIGPIVMASIFLQLFAGAKLIDLDMTSPEGRSKFQALQKILSVALCFIEGYIYIGSGLLTPNPGMLIPLVIQIAVGSLILLYLDEIVSKWGIGSGISLFIAGGVSATIFWRTFMPPIGLNASGGIIWSIFTTGDMLLLLPLIGVVAIFLIPIPTPPLSPVFNLILLVVG